jgi:hypothetical protein
VRMLTGFGTEQNMRAEDLGSFRGFGARNHDTQRAAHERGRQEPSQRKDVGRGRMWWTTLRKNGHAMLHV